MDIDRLQKALVAADAAGDKQGATALAQALRTAMAAPQPQQSVPVTGAGPTPGLGESVQHTAERAVAPTGGFFAGMGAMGATGLPEAAMAIPVAGPIVATGLELAGGFGGSALVDKLQQMGTEAFPEFAKRHGLDEATARREQAAHPVGTAIAGAAPMLLTNKFGAIENAKNLWEAGSQVLKGGVKSLTKEQAAKAAAPLVAGGIQGGINAAQQMISGQPFDYGDLATQAAIGASFGDERALGHRLRGVGAKATETVQNVFRPKTRDFLGDETLLKPAVQNASAADAAANTPAPAPATAPAAPKDALAEHMETARKAILDHGDEQERGAHIKAVEAATGLSYPKANALVNRLAKGDNRIITGASKKDGLRRLVAPPEAESPAGLSVDDLTQPLGQSPIESPSQPTPDYTTQLQTPPVGSELGGFPAQTPADFTPLIPPEVSAPAQVPANNSDTDPRGTILNFVNTLDKPTVKAIQDATGLKYGEVTKHLNSLKADGIIAYNPSSRKWEPTSGRPPANIEPDAGKPAEGAGPPVPPDTADGGSVDLTPSERLGITRAPSESPVGGEKAKPAPLTPADRKDPARIRRSSEIANENGLISDDDYFRIQNELKKTNPNYLLIERLMAGKGKHAVPIEPMEPADAGTPEPPVVAKTKRRVIKAKPTVGIPADLAPDPGAVIPESKPLTPEQQAAGTTQIKGKTGVNQVRAADIIAQQHGVTEELPAVTVKEMLQNSFDAIREMLRAGTLGKGRIDITGDKDSRTIAMTDNGKGMPPDILAGPFLEILGEGKEEGSGGFGAAKTVFLYGNKDIHVVTMHNGKVSEMRTSGDQLKASLADPKHAPDIEVRDPTPEDHALFPDGHGTRVSVKLPDTYKDEEGNVKDLPFDPTMWQYGSTWRMPEVLTNSPLFADIDITTNGHLLNGIGSTFDTAVHQPLANVKFHWGNAEVYIGHGGNVPSQNVRYLSDGIWQFGHKIPKDPNSAWGDPIPFNFYVNIIPKDRPGKPNYPFSLNRKSLLDWAKKDMNRIINHISALYRYTDLKNSADSFGTIRYFDKNGKLTSPVDIKPDIPPPPSKFTPINAGDKVSVKDGKLLINGKAQPELSPDELKAAVPSSGKLLVDPKLIDTKSPMVHDNMDVTDKSTGEKKSISEFMRDHYGQQFDEYTHVVGKAFLTLRDEVARIMGYPKLFDEAVGVSFDPEYRGVSIRVPFSGSFINALGPESSHPVQSAYGMLGTMIHELAHHEERNHNASFPAEMQRIIYKLEADEHFDFNQFKHDFVKSLQPYSDIISYGRELLENRNNINRKFDIEARGSRFKDGQPESGTRDGDASHTPSDVERSAEGLPEQPVRGGANNGATPPASGGGSGQGGGTPPGNGNVAPGKGPRRLKAASVPETADGFIEHLADTQKDKYANPSAWSRIKAALLDSPHKVYERYAYLIQNDKRYIKQIEDNLDLTNSNVIGGKDATNLYTTLTRVADMAIHATRTVVNPLVHEFNVKMKDYAEKTGLDINKARATISAYRIALHEPERRWEKFRTDVPFKTQKRPMGNTGRMVSPADLREMLIKKLADKKTSIAEGKQIGAALDALARDPANIDPLGDSPGRKGPAPMPTDMHDPFYSVLGEYNKTLIDNLTQAYHNDPHKAEADAIIAHLDHIQDVTKGLNYKAHYWNDYAEKISQFYGFQHYAPFKGMLRLDKRHEGGGGISKDYSDFAEAMEGRKSEAEDNVLQTLSDLSRAAGRATRANDDTGNVTQIIKNLINKKVLAGKKVGVVTAEERFLDKKIDKKFYGSDKIAHNLPNGDIEVYKINNPEISESIRRQYEENNPLMQLAHQMASGIGQLHTRYKIPFAPMNFTRHTLSNAWNFGSKEGIGAMGSYLQHVATSTIDLKMADTFKLSMLIADGKTAEIEKLRASDPYMRDAIEYMELGGKATYSQIYSARSHMAELEKAAGENMLLSTKDMVDKYFDAWNDMFDIVSRSSLYHVAKKMYMGRGMDETGAKIKAAAIAKEVTNYKLVGKYGRDAAALWLFFRPAATSSVAAIDALRPAWQSAEWRVKQLPEADQKDPVKVQAAIENHKKLQKNARIIAATLVGAGALTYEMSLQGSNNDAQGRNRVATDDMERWVRFARLPILGKEGFFQMPWGFGLGGLGSIGAQIAALAHGNQSVREAAGNIITAAADSGLPISPSHISPTKSWKSALEFMVDTITPSGPGIRPVVEYLMNSDSMGSEIYNTRQGKYSDVYTGGENIPQGYKDASRLLFHITGGAVEMSPNTMYFFAANYVDAMADMGNTMYNASNVLQGKKGFDLKSDTPFFGSFLGRDSNYDARRFESAQTKIQDKARILNTLKMSDTREYIDYISKHPLDPAVVHDYNSNVNKELKRIQTSIKGIRLNNNLTQEQREKEVKALKLYENIVKANLVRRFELMGTEP